MNNLFDTATKHLYVKSKERKETEETDYFDKTNHKVRASFPITRPTFQQ